MDDPREMQQPDEARPAKRVKLDAPLGLTEDVQEDMVDEESDWDDIYEPSAPTSAHAEAEKAAILPADAVESELQEVYDIEPTSDTTEAVMPEPNATGTDEPWTRMLEENPNVETSTPHQDAVLQKEADANTDVLDKSNGTTTGAELDLVEDSHIPTSNGNHSEPAPEPIRDVEFIQAAEGQKDDQEAEWQFAPSDVEASDSDSDASSDDTSDDSDPGSDGGYEMLDPATAARMLMAEEGDGDEDGKSGGKTGDYQPRTANEVKEEVIPKPDVVITEDMKVTHLGDVERTVDNLVMIKGATPGEYQVLEVGSVLCNEKREVIGAVADTFGRVQEPLYSVAFTNEAEIEEFGLKFGGKVFYVDDHSTFVFTQPLKNLKGTDASNIHDEEVGDDELEFSDDEEEQEYKRQRKAAKRGGRGTLSRSAFNDERATRSFGAPGHDSGQTYVSNSDAPQQQYGGGLSYDDGDVQDEFYVPLKRPDNLSQLMAGGGSLPPRPQQGGFDRGRGRGRGFDRGRGRGDRGRGDRGRGRGRFDQRGGRGGQHQARDNRGGRGRGGQQQDRDSRGGRGGQQNGFKGNAHSFPDRHNNDLQPSPRPMNQPVVQSSPPPQQQYQQHQPQAQNAQSYQFNGYTFQHGNPPPQPPVPQPAYYNQPAQRPEPPASIPPGAYVNPAFFQNQQMPAQWTQQPPQQAQYPQQPSYGGWQAQQYQQQQQQQQHAASGAAQPPVQQPNLADILKRMTGQQ